MLATQTLLAQKGEEHAGRASTARSPRGVHARRTSCSPIIGKIGTAGGTGYAIEFAGAAIRALSMEGRMTVCNMAIEAGARAGLVAVDETTIAYLQGPPVSRRPALEWDAGGRATGARCTPTPGAQFDAVVDARRAPRSSRRSPGARRRRWSSPIDGRVPDPEQREGPGASATRSSAR